MINPACGFPAIASPVFTLSDYPSEICHALNRGNARHEIFFKMVRKFDARIESVFTAFIRAELVKN